MPQEMNSRATHRLNILDFSLMTGIAAWLFCIFHVLGNTTDVSAFGRSTFNWMISRWSDATLYAGDFSHGWIIPLVSLYAAYIRRKEFVSAQKAVFLPAIWFVVAGLLLHWIGARAQQPRLSLFALIILLWGIPFFLYGKNIARLLVFPCFYLIFCIPLNFFDSLTFPLRMLASKISAGIINGLGIPVTNSGTAIHAVSGAFHLEVADPCSGIRSLLAITALTTAYAYFSLDKQWKRFVLVISSIPIAVIGNIIRIVTLSLIAQILGQASALKFFHDYSGYLVFIVVTLLMIGTGSLLKRIGTTATKETSSIRPPAEKDDSDGAEQDP